MEVFAELFKSPVGILSFLTIAIVMIIATCMFLFIKKQADNEEARKK